MGWAADPARPRKKLGKRLFLNITFGNALSRDDTKKVQAILLCERMKWELDYVKDLEQDEFDEVVTVLEAYDKGLGYLQQRASRRQQSGRRRR